MTHYSISFFAVHKKSENHLESHFKDVLTVLAKMFGNWKPFKIDEKCFLFHLKDLFLFKNNEFLFWLFGHVAKRFD